MATLPARNASSAPSVGMFIVTTSAVSGALGQQRLRHGEAVGDRPPPHDAFRHRQTALPNALR